MQAKATQHIIYNILLPTTAEKFGKTLKNVYICGWLIDCYLIFLAIKASKLALKYLIIKLMTNEELMREAIRLSEENVLNGGGPFGAVIARNGEIIATGVNRVTANYDPTAHAEVSAIRSACAKLKTFDLSGCEVFSSCEPCPMCLGAIYWAHLDKLYFGNNKTDAKNIGFDDSFIYDELELPRDKRKLPAEMMLPKDAFRAFRMWTEKDDKIEY